jgi:hypothetical protein
MVSEWSDEEVYAEFEARSVWRKSKPCLTREEIEAVIFDARFPEHLKPLAKQLLAKLKTLPGY